MDTIIDEKRIYLGLILNVYIPSFNPKIVTQKTEKPNNNASHQDIKGSSTKKVQEKININIDQNTTLQENKQYNELTNQEEQWRSIKKGIKQKT